MNRYDFATADNADVPHVSIYMVDTGAVVWTRLIEGDDVAGAEALAEAELARLEAEGPAEADDGEYWA